jgi:hypothetical protein
MTVLENNNVSISIANPSLVESEFSPARYEECAPDGGQFNYFDLLDETPEFSEAAILLEDDVIEYCYVKNGNDGKQYFGFDRCLPGADEYQQILARHKLINKMEANTFERYPSGKTILSRRGKIIEVNSPNSGGIYV